MSRRDSDLLPVSVVLPVRNEESNIGEAIASVSWAAEIVVVDSNSEDRTREIAEQGAPQVRVVDFDYVIGGSKKKAWILSKHDFENDWVLFLDGDERVTAELSIEIAQAIQRRDVSGYYLDREFIFMQRSLRAFRPNWNMRLFRHDRARIESFGLEGLPQTGDNEIHEHFEVEGNLGFLKHPLLHKDIRGIGPWIDRHNRYAIWEAHLYRKLRAEPVGTGPIAFLRLDAFRRKRVLRRVWVRLPFRPVIRFFWWYILRRGFRDGREGLIYSYLMAWYEVLISLNAQELSEDIDAFDPR